jgi:hypothetical protein
LRGGAVGGFDERLFGGPRVRDVSQLTDR